MFTHNFKEEWIIALNEKAHQEHLMREGITEDQWEQRCRDHIAKQNENFSEQRILVSLPVSY